MINEMTAQEVETFLAANAVDMGAGNQLRREPVHIALAVIERGPLRSCRDPNGVIVARIRDAKKGILGPAQTGPAARSQPQMPPVQVSVDPNMSEIDKFLTINRIDAAGVISLKSESLDVQIAVMSKGPLVNSTNPSASLVSRIRLAKEPGAMPGMPLVPGLVSGQPPPPAGTPALAIMPPPPAITDTSFGDMSADVQKAIQKLGQSQAPAPPGLAPPPPSVLPVGGENGNNSNSLINNIDDKRLQDEALKAIQGLNYADL